MYFLYFDAGTGAMIVQAVVAAGAGILLFSRGAMYKVKSFFGLIKEDPNQGDTYDSIDIEEQDIDKDDRSN